MDFISLSRFENLEHVDLFIRVVLNVRNGGWLMAGWLAGWLAGWCSVVLVICLGLEC